MPTKKKKKYNARFPPARIKKIMQSDEEIGKVAAAVPVIISRSLELFVENLLKKTFDITSRRGARTLTPSHIKLCINSEARFDFLKELVSTVPDLHGDCDDQPRTPSTPIPSPFHTSHPSRQNQNPILASRPPTLLPRQLSTPKPRGRKRKESHDMNPPTARLRPETSKTATDAVPKKRGRKKKILKEHRYVDDARPEPKLQPSPPSQKHSDEELNGSDNEEPKSNGSRSHHVEESPLLGSQSKQAAKSTLQKIDSPSKDVTRTTSTLNTVPISPAKFELHSKPKLETEYSVLSPKPSASLESTNQHLPVQTFVFKQQTPASKSVALFPDVSVPTSRGLSPKPNHIPMHLVTATAVATAKPAIYRKQPKKVLQRSEMVQSGGLTFSMTYPLPAMPFSKSDSTVGSPSLQPDQPVNLSSIQKPSNTQSAPWSIHGSVDEDYDA